MKNLTYYLTLLLCLISCTKSKSQNDIDAFTNVIIIDVIHNHAISGHSVLVKGDKIFDIVPNSQLKETSYNFIDCKNAFVLPGFIDTHIHSTILNYDLEKGHLDSYDKEGSLASLNTMLRFGITTVRSVGGPTMAAMELKKLTKDSISVYPNVFTTGYALNKSNVPPFRKVTTKEEVKNEVLEQKKQGVDFIKVYASLEPELTEYAIEEAHKQGLKVIGHLQKTSWTQASSFGIDFITHAAPWSVEYLSENDQIGYKGSMKDRLLWIEKVDYSSQAIIQMLNSMKEANVSLDPTLIAFHTKFWAKDSVYTQNVAFDKLPNSLQNMWSSASFVGDWEPKDFIKAQSLWTKLTELTLLVFRKGIPITVGTDFPNPWVYPGKSFHDEMRLLSQAKISNIEVIKAATINGARAIGLESTIGSIEKGKTADLVFLYKNPIEDISNTESIKWVLKKGIIVK